MGFRVCGKNLQRINTVTRSDKLGKFARIRKGFIIIIRRYVGRVRFSFFS